MQRWRVCKQAIAIGKAEGLTRFLAEVYGSTADIYRQAGDLKTAQRFAESAAEASQESGDFWGAPQRLMAVAELQVSRGEYADADRSYDRAEAFIDSVIGQSSTALAKTAAIRASSEIFTQHFALAARMNDPAKAYEHYRACPWKSCCGPSGGGKRRSTRKRRHRTRGLAIEAEADGRSIH